MMRAAWQQNTSSTPPADSDSVGLITGVDAGIDTGELANFFAETLHEAFPWLGEHPAITAGICVLILLLLAALAGFLFRRYLLRMVTRLIKKSRTRWDDVVLEHGVLTQAARIAPALVIYLGISAVPYLPEEVGILVRRVAAACLVLFLFLAFSALLSASHAIYRTRPVAQGRPIKGYVQIGKLFLAIFAGILIVALLLGRSPWVFVTGLGAMTAVLLLIFRDTILSFVASLQLASNDMVRLGDWISVPQFGADGDVVDIALHTVKVQNWDKTITTIPTYRLIEGSFKNWRGMTQSGGRRIKRSLSLDMSSVHFLGEEDIERFGKFALLEDYIAEKKQALAEYNAAHARGPEAIDNARRLTNLGTFRAYIAAYLKQHPGLHHDTMTFLVRQLSPGPEGVPIEIYVFTRDTAWVSYEAVQGDIFDHLLAILPEFGLRVFQNPTGADFSRLMVAGSPPTPVITDAG